MALSARSLACTRGDQPLFEGIDLHLDAGEALWVQGRNGSGKTSLLRLLCGLSTPWSGHVLWHGRDIRTQRDDFHRELLYIGHAGATKDDLTPTENLLLGSRIGGRRATHREAADALDRVGLSAVAGLPAGSLSQGQRRRTMLARLQMPPVPTLLVLDEPFNALDQEAADHLGEALQGHLARGGMVVYTAHQPLALNAARLHRLALGGARPC